MEATINIPEVMCALSIIMVFVCSFTAYVCYQTGSLGRMSWHIILVAFNLWAIGEYIHRINV